MEVGMVFPAIKDNIVAGWYTKKCFEFESVRTLLCLFVQLIKRFFTVKK